VSEIRRM